MRLRWLLVGVVVTLLLVPAVLLTVARLLQPASGPVVRVVAFTPYAVPLYATAFLLLALSLVVGRGGWRPMRASVTVLCFGGLAVHAFWVSPLFAGAEAVADRGERLRVMTVNLLRGQASAPQVVRVARRHGVDVLVLVEVDDRALARLRRAGLSETFPYQAGEPADGVAGTVVVADRDLVGEQRLPTGLGGYSVRAGDVTVVAVHARPPVGGAAEWREDHLAIRRAAVERPDPTVIVGDFNATVDHRVMQELHGRGYVDAAVAANSGWQPTWPSDGRVRVAGARVPPLLAIDHVLTNDALEAVRTETYAIEGTDHRALLAVLTR
jgi:endonuclease/exonuclease/phosphatase (EEP) superfamily protein YafD